MRDQLIDKLLTIKSDPKIKVCVLLGEGRAFCAGQDLKEKNEETQNTTPARKFIDKLDEDIHRYIQELGKPTIAGIHGYALGRGLLIALACDIRISSDDAKFGLPEVRLGIIPASGGTQRLVRLVGQGRALHLVVSGETIDAKTALLWGIVTKIYPKDDFRNKVIEFAESISENAPLAIEYSKMLIQIAGNTSLTDGLMIESSLSALIHTSNDWIEGKRAFKEKRKPKFEGF